MSESIVPRSRREPGCRTGIGDGVTTELAIFDWARGAFEGRQKEVLRSRVAQNPQGDAKVSEARLFVTRLRGLQVKPSGRVERTMSMALRQSRCWRRLFAWARTLKAVIRGRG